VKRGAALACALLLTATACQSDPPNDEAKLAVFDTEPRPQPAPADIFDVKPQRQTAASVSDQLAPMTPADIRRSAMTCLQSPPYPLDGGPLCLRPDGSWIIYSGWGNSQGRYTIVGNEVRMQDGMVRDAQRVAFYRTADGRIYMRYLDSPEGRSFRFEPYSEADYLNGM